MDNLISLGDWDERSTQLLIQLIQKYPQTYFLLTMKNERRMIHWEKLHKEMEAAGYNFTILQVSELYSQTSELEPNFFLEAVEVYKV